MSFFHPLYFFFTRPDPKVFVCVCVGVAARAGSEDCVDTLAVREGGEGNADLVRECGEREEELVIESDRGALDVNLTTRSVNAFPSRGVLIHYKGEC